MRVEFKEISTDNKTGIIHTRAMGFISPDNPKSTVRYELEIPDIPIVNNKNVGFKARPNKDAGLNVIA